MLGMSCGEGKKEGGFNRVFIYSMDKGARVAARIPFHVAGPKGLMTHSEVATMAYDKHAVICREVWLIDTMQSSPVWTSLCPSSLIGTRTNEIQ